MPPRDRGEGWEWLERPTGPPEANPDLCRAFHACFAGPQGELALGHLRRVFLDRRVPPSASDAELRHAEGQRSVVAYVVGLIERARDRREDRF